MQAGHLFIVLVVAVLAGCTPPPTPAPAPLPTPPLSEEDIGPIERPHIVIIDLNEIPSSDKKLVRVSGKLVNRGRGATREVYVHVEALNREGAVVQSADSEPTTELIAPGSTADFAVTFENRGDVDHYHVEAMSR